MQSTLSLRAVAARSAGNVNRLAVRQTGLVRPRIGGRVMAVQATKDFDFDALLATAADKFEKSENKTAIVGYGAAAGTAILTAEWLIHLPLLDFLLGFPIQLLGLVMLPYLGIKYFVEGDDYTKDAEAALKKVTDQLPGLGKK